MTTFLPQKKLSDKWMKATVLGSYWALVEIVAGSFLHNMKIPMAGSILSFITVFLVIAFFQLWKTNGIIWRAGLICALMRSISPGSIIIGPMIGIFSEAIILEVTIWILGKNIFSYALGGAFVLFSAIIHKTISLLILYGLDFVLIIKNIYNFAANQIGIENVSPFELLLIISGIYLFSGALAGVFGTLAGKNHIKNSNVEFEIPKIERKVRSDLFEKNQKSNQSILFLVFILISLIGLMILINTEEIFVPVLMSFAFLTIIKVRYKKNMKFLGKPLIWFHLILILVFSAIFFEGFSLNNLFNSDGWIIGINMVLRALLLLSAFSAISYELKNPIIRKILYDRGLNNLYLSMELAFSGLPLLMDTFSKKKYKHPQFNNLLNSMLGNSGTLFEIYSNLEKNKPVVFIVLGDINSGKTSSTKNIVTDLKCSGIKVKGFYSVSSADEYGHKKYDVEDIETGKKELLCSEIQLDTNIKAGRFHFSEKGIEHGCNIIKKSLKEVNDLIVIDEIGPLEIQDKGWAPAIEPFLMKNRPYQLWVVREKLVPVIIRKWNLGDVYIFDIKKEPVLNISGTIREIISTGLKQ